MSCARYTSCFGLEGHSGVKGGVVCVFFGGGAALGEGGEGAKSEERLLGSTSQKGCHKLASVTLPSPPPPLPSPPFCS